MYIKYTPSSYNEKLRKLCDPVVNIYYKTSSKPFVTEWSEEMAQIFKGMVEEHARAGVAHDTADAIAHFRPITMDGAFAA